MCIKVFLFSGFIVINLNKTPVTKWSISGMEVLDFGKAVFNECVTGLTSVLSVALHNGENEGQLIMYSVPVLWACCIIVKHKRSLCACLPPEPSHIPELLLDTAVPLSEEAPDGPAAPRPPDLPEDPVDLQGQAGESLVPLFLAHNLR